MISAIVLAAGASGRMGTPKALLPIGGRNFLRHIVEVITAAGVREVTVVLGADAPEIQKTLSWFEGSVIINESWRQGQLSSLRAGLHAVRGSKPEGIMVWAVDHPLASLQTVLALAENFRTHPASIVVPAFQGKRGHPVIFSQTFFGDLENISPERGARQVLHEHPEAVVELDVPDQGILVNIDTPDDYARHRGSLTPPTTP